MGGESSSDVKGSVNSARVSLVATGIAAKLSEAEKVARHLLLAAKNARATMARAGSDAAGLKVISEYFSELANLTISLAKEINQTAFDITKVSVVEWRTREFLHQLENAEELVGSPFTGHLGNIKHQTKNSYDALSEESRDLMKELETLLTEIQNQMRAVGVVVITSRLEASRTGAFEESLNNMADNIQELSDKIKSRVNSSYSQLVNEIS